VQEAKDLEANLIVHFGHAEFMKHDIPVLYIEVKDILDLDPILEKSWSKLSKFKKIGIACSVQHLHNINKVVDFYESKNKKVVLSKKFGHAAYAGHVIGCEYSGLKAIEDNVDCFVILGNRFHSIGAALALKKPVFLLDVYNDEVSEMSLVKDKILKQRFAIIEKMKSAKNIGIIIETKPGQNFGSPKFLMEKLEKKDKKGFLIVMNEITPEKLMNFYHLDGFIELACPRIAIDDFARYAKPIVTYKEALVALGEKSWKDILDKGIF
jgi:2-(3-amino-3-carboxypropyl)histidine synthase